MRECSERFHRLEFSRIYEFQFIAPFMSEEMILEKKSFWIILFITWRDIFHSQRVHILQCLLLKRQTSICSYQTLLGS